MIQKKTGKHNKTTASKSSSCAYYLTNRMWLHITHTPPHGIDNLYSFRMHVTDKMLNIISRIMCAIGVHVPSRESIAKHGPRIEGNCRHCGKALLRNTMHDWVVADATKAHFRHRIPLCLIGRHYPNAHAARWDGDSFVSRCSHCRKPIRRAPTRRWRYDPERA
ncbi:hypothetical protein GRI39_09575 [Altererythrobacter indicus]|uniref:Uncharacterized protein n=1 Tax=Altericroceibacterium indicum TaxID=374177 RepID=A0A845A9A8_9SPHN|nr:hypothetical protein [Altericroceibacterium indicum]MXP26284.1 hypothetical protein [Altericroceibacterium indicum]